MRKQTSAGFIAGAISGLCVGLAFAAVLFWITWSRQATYPIQFLSEGAMVFVETIVGLMVAGACTLIGTVSGVVFVVATNKLLIRSTYIKALIPVPIVWLLYRLSLILISSSHWSAFGASYLFIESVEGAGVLALGTILFAYLFNRWSK